MNLRVFAGAMALAAGLLPAIVFGQNKPKPASAVNSREQEWKQVDSLSDIGLPKSALLIVERIYKDAKSKDDSPEWIKAVIYRIKLYSTFKEDFLVGTIHQLDQEISTAGEPVKQVLQSIQAEVYMKYYQNNLYRFSGRSSIGSVIPDSLQTWDLDAITHAIFSTYLASLGNENLLKSTPINKFRAIIEIPGSDGGIRPYGRRPANKAADPSAVRSKETETAMQLRPTLYDFLANRALEYFSVSKGPRASNARGFLIDKPSYFALPAAFSVVPLPPGDGVTPSPEALRIFQKLAAFHLGDKDPAALIDAELGRLDYVRHEAALENRDSLWLETMKKFDALYMGSPSGTSISFALARFYQQESASEYQDLHSMDLVKALEICDRAVKRFPASDGAKNCSILATGIRNPEFQLQCEDEIMPGKPSLALVSYRNMNRLYLRLFKADPEDWKSRRGTLGEKEIKEYLVKQQVVRSWGQGLAVYADYQKHSQEIGLEGVKPGFYILAESADSSFTPSSSLFAFCSFTSTSFNYTSHKNADGSLTVFIFNRDEGSPAQGVTAEAWSRSWNSRNRSWDSRKLDTYLTDNDGMVNLPAPSAGARSSELSLKIISGEDVFFTRSFYQYAPQPIVDRPAKQTDFFTDRGIYRPGQTVWFKGILMERRGNDTRLLCGEKTRVVFTDANGRMIGDQTFTTSDFGSFNGSFIAPPNALLGMMSISNESGSVQVSVEEYKRPTFEVSFDELKDNYRLNQAVNMSGKAMAYAGNAVPGATVKYRVVRKARFPFWDRWFIPFPVSDEAEISSGSVLTAADGSFAFSFTALADAKVLRSSRPVFDFVITADVTDASGETRSAEQTVTAGYQGLVLGISAASLLNLQTDSLVKITASNLNGKATPLNISVEVFRLKTPSLPFVKKYWGHADTTLIREAEYRKLFPQFAFDSEDDTLSWKPSMAIMQQTVYSGKDSLVNLKRFTGQAGKSFLYEAGVYMMKLFADDPYGGRIEMKKYFTMFDPASQHLAGNPVNFFVPLKTRAQPGESAKFLLGSSEKDIRVLYEIRLQDSLVSRKWLDLSNSQMLLEVPVIEKYRGNFSVSFLFGRAGRIYQDAALVSVPYPDKKLDIRFETFRSKIRPGEKEVWKIKISRQSANGSQQKSDGKLQTADCRLQTSKSSPAEAEFVTTMYDASLDAFRPNTWSFSLYRRFFGSSPWDVGYGPELSTASAAGKADESGYREAVYPQLNWFGMNYFGGRQPLFQMKGARAGGLGVMEISVEDMASKAQPGEVQEIDKTADLNAAASVSEKVGGSGVAPKIQIRKDFRETAFFYPDLRTDSTGALLLSFTAPDALTRWNILGFAHTKNLDYALIQKELYTQKEIMVVPNTPRFIRQGDEAWFSTRVVNMANEDIKATVKLSLCNGISMKSADSLVAGALQQDITIAKGGTGVVSWMIRVPVDPSLSLLQYRITATAGVHTDGEETMIPVLTNRMMVTEALPLPMKGKGTVEFSMDKLLNSSKDKTLNNYRLTLEFASNPAWYAVQALPSLNEKQYDDAYSVFGAFYSNSIAAKIMNSDAKIKAVFQSWKTLTPDALVSNLEKNEQLKTVLLQQTPWVNEAASETGNRLRLGMYFDPQNLISNLKKNLAKLHKLQAPNGGWTWFDGMPENRSITQGIITGLGRLSVMGYALTVDEVPGYANSENIDELKEMAGKGVRFMDDAFARDYAEMLRRYPGKADENHLDGTEIAYLYARSFFVNTLPSPANTLAPLKYYLGQAEKYWTKCALSQQASLAIALQRFGRKETAALIMKSLTERALHSQEMGMYWAEEPGMLRRQADIGTQALLIEAFDEVSADAKSVEDLKVWLLKQKQTRMWESSRATVDACYALLMRGTGLLTEDPKVKISLGPVKVDPSKMADLKQEAGTGYFQLSWSGKEISPAMGKVKITKGSDGVAWGALYWQYFENLDKITPASTPLKLEKKLFVERNTPTGPVLDAVSGGVLHIGDKLKVRIVLTVDRDLEFVHMRDMRASGFEPYEMSLTGGNSDSYIVHGTSYMGSGYRYQDGLGYYQSTSDASTDFFFSYIGKGTYVFEYPLIVNAPGDYSNGITSVQCMYAPEFAAHSEGIRVEIAK